MNQQPLIRVNHHKHLGLILDDKMTWKIHLNSNIAKANRLIGTIWKLGINIPRYCLTNYYICYIRPILEYACVCYDNITEEQSKSLEKVQRRAAISCTHAYQQTPTKILLRELSWPPLKKRREYYRLVVFYKMVSGISPGYLTALVLPTSRNIGMGPTTRSANMLRSPRTNTESFRKSFLPSTIRLWNTMDTNIKASTSVYTFKLRIKSTFSQPRNKLTHSMYGTSAIHHSRIRMG